MDQFKKKIKPEAPKANLINIKVVQHDKAISDEERLRILEKIKIGKLPEPDTVVVHDSVPHDDPNIQVDTPDDPPTVKPTAKPDDPPTVKPTAKPTAKPIQKPISPHKIESYAVLQKYMERLPESIVYSPSRFNYYMNNRAIFLSFINGVLSHYKEDLAEEKLNLDCTKSDNFTLLSHQKIVRDYINVFTPYRGLLLYHGLGSGKTCSSIAIAEGMKNNKNILIMTPASLQSNYIKELKFCGDMYYKKKQFWEWISVTDTEEIKSLSSVLSLSVSYIKKKGGVWLVKIKETSNYERLDTTQQTSLENQLDEMIRSKYQFVNYNGITKTNWYKHLCKDEKMVDNKCADGNPFDNKVVIIDEAHNFISRIANKLKDKTHLFIKLYEYLILAVNCKIVLLTGTPVVNYPNEVGILFNILRGAISTWKIDVKINAGAKKINLHEIKKIIKQSDLLSSSIDYINYQVANKKLIITRNPLGYDSKFASAAKTDAGYEGVRKNPDVQITDKEVLTELKAVFLTNKIVLSDPNVENHRALPDSLEGFIKDFVGPDTKLKNKNKLQKRIVGLVSFFPDLVKLMPTFNKAEDIEEVRVKMSAHQLSIYERERNIERKKETKKSAPKKKADHMYNDSASTYRIFSRSSCNFVFPNFEDKPKYDYEEDSSDTKQKLDAPIKTAIQKLVANASTNFSEEGLAMYSPKFLQILLNIQNPEHAGLHLLYSAFRSLEGIGIFKAVLDYQRYSEFKLKKVAKVWTLDTLDPTKPHYALYTGTEDAEEKEIIRNIYNGEWELVPKNISDELLKTYTTNKLGEIIKVIMITAAGAEGISLKNTRYVHIMEPYWHPVRTDQVIGRARRICSHNELEVALQTVKVFLYLTVFSEEQLDPKNKTTGISKELRFHDKSKFDKKIQTTDEYIYQVANQKRKINEEILEVLKDTSIDCNLHKDEDNPRNCKTFANTSKAAFSYEPNITKDEDDRMEARNKKLIKQTYKVLQADASEQLNNKFNGKFLYVYNEQKTPPYDIIRLPSTYGLNTLTTEIITTEGVIIGQIIKGDDGKKKIKLENI